MASWPTAPIAKTSGFNAAQAPLSPAVPPYLSTEQLARLTPWSVQGINTMRKRGTFKRGIHYFQPAGRCGQVIFKWSAVIELIEGRASSSTTVVEDARSLRKTLNVEDATTAVQQLLG